MSENIIVALIGAVAVIIAAIIGACGNRSNKDRNKRRKARPTIQQNISGDGNTGIGIQNNYGTKEK